MVLMNRYQILIHHMEKCPITPMFYITDSQMKLHQSVLTSFLLFQNLEEKQHKRGKDSGIFITNQYLIYQYIVKLPSLTDLP